MGQNGICAAAVEGSSRAESLSKNNIWGGDINNNNSSVLSLSSTIFIFEPEALHMPLPGTTNRCVSAGIGAVKVANRSIQLFRTFHESSNSNESKGEQKVAPKKNNSIWWSFFILCRSLLGIFMGGYGVRMTVQKKIVLPSALCHDDI